MTPENTAKLPFISVIVPCREEGKFIAKCLDSIVSQDYPASYLEVFVVDGMSEDGTRDVVRRYAEKYEFIQLLDNYDKIVPTALNTGIRRAEGEIIIRMDAHNIYSRDYISRCVENLQKYTVDNVGGIIITLPGDNSVIAESIALALSHPFGAGNAYFRIGSKKPRYVDTVPFGCYRREVFQKIGLFDEDLAINHDDEFNFRLLKSGGKILLVPDIVSYYYARDSLSKVRKMYYQYGYFKPLVAQKVGGILTWRQLVPGLLVGSLIILLLLSVAARQFLWLFTLVLSLYAALDLIFSLLISMTKGFKYFFILPVVFATLHFSYGIGYLKGIWDFIVFKKHRNKKVQEVPLTR